jgi:hypothetical protein
MQNENNIAELRTLIRKLISLGENLKELSFWEGIFSDLTPKEQKEILENLRSEVEAIEKLKR